MKVDATSLAPQSARHVYLNGEPYSREGLETAWLLLAEHGGVRIAAAAAMHKDGWELAQAAAFVRAAERWTGEVVSSLPKF